MVKLGKPLPIPEEIARPSEEELDAINTRWDAFCPPYYRGLLEAQNIHTEKPTARFLFDKARMVYIHRASGRVLTSREVADAFIAYSKKAAGV